MRRPGGEGKGERPSSLRAVPRERSAWYVSSSRVAPLGILLSLLSGLAWAGLDSQRKALGTKVGSLPLLVVLALGQAPVFLVWGLATHARASSGYVLPALGSLAINVAANLLFLRAVQLSALSKTVPFLAFTPVFAALNALVLLHELPSSLAWCGIGCVGAGGVLLALAPGHTLLEALRKDPGAWRMLLVALLWSVSSSLDKLALRHATVPLHAAVQTGGWQERLGDHLYDYILAGNRLTRGVRARLGLGHWSLAQFLKRQSGQAERYIERYVRAALGAAAARGVDGIVCGHIHRAALEQRDGLVYANDGDWVESLTAIAESACGTLRLLQWTGQARTLAELQAAPLLAAA